MTLRRIRDHYYIDLRIKGTGKRIRRTLGTSIKAEALELYEQEKDRVLAEHHKKEIRLENFITDSAILGHSPDFRHYPRAGRLIDYLPLGYEPSRRAT